MDDVCYLIIHPGLCIVCMYLPPVSASSLQYDAFIFGHFKLNNWLILILGIQVLRVFLAATYKQFGYNSVITIITRFLVWNQCAIIQLYYLLFIVCCPLNILCTAPPCFMH